MSHIGEGDNDRIAKNLQVLDDGKKMIKITFFMLELLKQYADNGDPTAIDIFKRVMVYIDELGFGTPSERESN